jgi:hypothetical protein
MVEYGREPIGNHRTEKWEHKNIRIFSFKMDANGKIKPVRHGS